MRVLILSLFLSFRLMADCPICSDVCSEQGLYHIGAGLQAVGLQVSKSCEGHLECGCPYPWVALQVSRTCCFDREFACRDWRRDLCRCSSIEERGLQLSAPFDRIHVLLNAFYADRKVSYDAYLFVSGRRLQSIGAQQQCGRCLEERGRKLQLYREELQAFADFVIHCNRSF